MRERGQLVVELKVPCVFVLRMNMDVKADVRHVLSAIFDEATQ